MEKNSSKELSKKVWKKELSSFLSSTVIYKERSLFPSALFWFCNYAQVRSSGHKAKCPCPVLTTPDKQTQPGSAPEGDTQRRDLDSV